MIHWFTWYVAITTAQPGVSGAFGLAQSQTKFPSKKGREKKKALFRLVLAWLLCCRWLIDGRSACLILCLPCSLFTALSWCEKPGTDFCQTVLCIADPFLLSGRECSIQWLSSPLLRQQMTFWNTSMRMKAEGTLPLVRQLTNFCCTRCNVSGSYFTYALLQSCFLELVCYSLFIFISHI